MRRKGKNSGTGHAGYTKPKPPATKAQRAALRYLVEHGRTENIEPTALAPMYAASSDLRPTAARDKSWKRTSGTNMARMHRDGLLAYDRITPHGFTFKLTEKGLEVARG